MLSLFLDAILLPKEYYISMAVRKRTYWRCACVVGALNICYPLVIDNFQELFVGKGAGALAINILIVAAFALAVGLIDTFVYCKPLADFLSRIPGLMAARGEAGGADGGAAGTKAGGADGGAAGAKAGEPTAVGGAEVGESGGAEAGAAGAAGAIHGQLFLRTVKVYALSAIIVTPLAIAVQEAYRVIFHGSSNGAQLNIVVAALAAMQIWAFGIVSRGMSGFLRCAKRVQRAFVFFVVASWSILWGVTFSWLVLDNDAVYDALFALFR